MEKFVKGDIIVVPFPFSNLTDKKRRPALVLADLPLGDVLLCQITSQFKADEHSIELNATDFSEGTLPQKCYIRPHRVFAADSKIVLYKSGHLNPEKVNEVIENLISLLRK